MSDQGFRQGYDLLMDRMPDPPRFEEIATSDPPRRSVVDAVPRSVAVMAMAVLSVVAFGAIALFDLGRTGTGGAGSPGELPTPTFLLDPGAADRPAIEFGSPLFGRELPWTLVFDNGYDRVKAVDLNQGIPYETAIPGGAPGDQPYRLTSVDGRLVVGWGGIYSYNPTTASTTHLGQATVYVPAAEQGRVWMIDYRGRIGANSPDVWQVSAQGEVVLEPKRLDIEGHPAIGIPDGLAVKSDSGIQLWDYETGEVIQTLGSEFGFVSDSSADGLVAWCSELCEQMQVDAVGGDTRGFRHLDGETVFDPSRARFSPDGRFLAAPAGRDVVLIDLENDTTSAIRVLTAPETMFVNWAPSGSYLFVSTYSYGERSMSISYVDVLGGVAKTVEMPFGGTLDFVVLPTESATSLLGFDCPVTMPTPSGFLASEPWPSHYPPGDNVFWYGTDGLWTALPIDPSEYERRKSVWWSANFPGGGIEEQPEITVYWRRLDITTPVITQVGGTNARTGREGWFMIAGVDPHEPGCWQVTATYKGATLSYVYDNRR